MKNLKEYFAPELSPEERLNNFSAYTQGTAQSLEIIGSQLDSLFSFIEMELEDNPATAKYFDQTCKIMDKLSSITGELIKHSAGIHVLYEKIDVSLMFDAIVRRLNKVFPSGVISMNDSSSPVIIEGNLLQLQDILLPLLSDFMNKNKKLYINTSKTDLTEEGLALFQSDCVPGNYYKITVSDVENPENSKIVPFSEMLKSEDRPEYATIYLLLYGVIKQHSGDIYCRKIENKTWKLEIILPVFGEISYMQSESTENIDDEALFGTETILLVDDEDMIWDVVIDMLQNMGYTVILAADGKDAVDIYAANKDEIDLVLLDMLMPEMNGQTAFFELQKIDPHVKVLLSSGYVDEKDAQEVLEAGALGFLKKPYRMVDLTRKIRSIFSRKL
ncbi:MAG: response regulator [Verrucomicrobiota bacterium]|nr:response regulator [Verrucomicrobiota bacterium]